MPHNSGMQCNPSDSYQVRIPESLIQFDKNTWVYVPNPDIEIWLANNASGRYRIVRDQNVFSRGYDAFDIRVRFEHPEDAFHFNLTWKR